MQLNHNLFADNALNRLRVSDDRRANSMSKISSGMRIRSAADNSAGLTISESMKAQIRGIQQAARNVQDGISMLQTIDGGLAQIINPNLQRLRELSVQASNETLTQEDRKMIQAEIDGIKQSIDNIANGTEFNSIKVLRPPVIEKPPIITPGRADVIFIVDNTGSMSDKIQKVKNNMDEFVNKLKSNGVDLNLGLISYGDISDGTPNKKFLLTSDAETFKNNLSQINITGGGDWAESGLEAIKDPNGAFSYNLRKDQTGLGDTPTEFILITDAPVHSQGGEFENKRTDSKYTIQDVADELKSKGIKLTVVGPDNNDNAKQQLEVLSKTTGGQYLNVQGNFGQQLDSVASGLIIEAGSKHDMEDMPTLKIQKGPNSKDEFSIELFDSRSFKLGIKDVLVDPIEEAQKSIATIDKAMQLVSNERSKFGGYTNALEHVQNNLFNYDSNLTEANSRIVDADVASEILELNKYSILSNAAQAIISQSNNIQNGILENIIKGKVGS